MLQHGATLENCFFGVVAGGQSEVSCGPPAGEKIKGQMAYCALS